MSKKLKFIWIDDNPKRKGESVNLKNRLGVSLEFKDVKNNDLTETLKDIIRNSEPDMIIIDHKLEEVESGVFKTGSSVAAFIREKWPGCPIVCVSAIDKKDVDSPQRILYEEMFPFSKISEFNTVLLSIAKSFGKLKNDRPQRIEDILKLLKAPKDQYEKLTAIMPKELKENYDDTGLLTEISHWVRKILIERPGFLYDKLWAATLLGIKESSFEKVENVFKTAKYNGLFVDSSNDRWWKNKLLAILSANVSERGLPWEKGRKLPKITKSDFSKCYSSKEDYPETVAYIDETSPKRVAMKLNYTVPHPRFEDLLFFEEIRMMKPAE